MDIYWIRLKDIMKRDSILQDRLIMYEFLAYENIAFSFDLQYDPYVMKGRNALRKTYRGSIPYENTLAGVRMNFIR